MSPSYADRMLRADRRESQRHYLTRPLRAELVFGRQRIGIESGRICDISDGGIGVRALQRMNLGSGAALTVAVVRDDKVVTLSGRVATIRHGTDIGVQVAPDDGKSLVEALDAGRDSVTATPPRDGRASLAGTVSMAARHPVRWVLKAGATRLDMSGVTALDSSGIGLLLQINERDGVTIEKCAPQVCRIIKFCRTATLCSPDCRNAQGLKAG